MILNGVSCKNIDKNYISKLINKNEVTIELNLYLDTFCIQQMKEKYLLYAIFQRKK